ncbi:MAG: branched-chain amino acid aminotransferase [Alphaproteobacteria bacterium]|nr:branched-chain amino acid aminotransferase [Alphaproteobacteria bacterium]MBV8549565.1 branched-chain amino acid aminotransferase [Alphaproteobacteria bacterium]
MLQNQPGVIWMDGKLVPWKDAHVHVLTHTLHYGSGVFEGERAYDGVIFKMQEHHERLHASAGMMGFTLPYSVDVINQAAMDVLQENNLKDAYVRPVAWHGPESLSVSSRSNSIHLAIAAWKWASYFQPNPDGSIPGIRLIWADWVRPAPNVGPVFAKANGQYIAGTVSKNKAELAGYNDALMLDYRGYVAECTGANIFMVKDGTIYTPIADCFLNGITRRSVIDIARQLGLTVTEQHITPAELSAADEVFITGTAVEVQPIIEIGMQKYPSGPITTRINQAYQKAVRGHTHA